MVTVEVIIALVVFVFTYLLLQWYRNPMRKIPGPSPLPILGNSLQMSLPTLHLKMVEWAQKYGPIIRVNIFTEPIILVGSAELMKEALVKKGTDFADRPQSHRLRELKAVEEPHDPMLGKFRKLFAKALKTYGPGTEHLENVLNISMEKMIGEMKAKDCEPIDSHKIAMGFAGGSVASLLYGEENHFEDPAVEEIVSVSGNFALALDPLSLGAIFDALPFLRKFKFILPETQKILDKAKRGMIDYFENRYSEGLQRYNADKKKGMLDHLIEMQKESVGSASVITDEQVMAILRAVVIGGIDTTYRIISQVLLNLANHPEIAKKIQQTIDKHFGPTDPIGMSDRAVLPYLDAFIIETMRHASLQPFLFPRAARVDSEIAGYKIAKGTIVGFNVYQIMHNPEVYEDPFEIKPERFLDEEGKMVPLNHPARSNVLFFGIGRRNCPGDMFGKYRVFKFVAHILRAFDLQADGPVPSPNPQTYHMETANLLPPSVKIRFIPRSR